MKELAPEEFGHDLDGNEEFLSASEKTPILCQTASGDDHMHMGMKAEVLSPCVQDRGKAGLRTQIFRVGGKLPFMTTFT